MKQKQKEEQGKAGTEGEARSKERSNGEQKAEEKRKEAAMSVKI